MPTLKRKVLSSIFAEPRNHEKYKNEKRSRGIGSLIPKSPHTKLAQQNSEKPAARTDRERYVTAGSLCNNKIGDESCWAITADQAWQDKIHASVVDLLDAQNHKLYERDRREFDPWMELFLVGQTLEDARLAMVISCNSEADYERLQKLLKKFKTVPDNNEISLLTMLGGPRSTVSLIPLVASPDPNPDRPRKDDQLLVGTPVYGVLDSRQSITIPSEIWIGRSLPEAHRAVLGGLISTGSRGTKLGLTVGHTNSSHSTHSGNDGPVTRSLIGTIESTAPENSNGYLDWALVNLNQGIRTQTNSEPPNFINPGHRTSMSVNLLAPRGTIHGTLSASLTYISIKGGRSFSRTQAVVLDEPIMAGDCGIWVVGQDGTLYGHVAFGHAGDKVAYLIPAANVFDDIDKANPEFRGKASLAGLDESSQRKILQNAKPEANSRARSKSPDRSHRRRPRGNTDSTDAKLKVSKRSKRLSLHRKWKQKFRRDDRQSMMKFAGTCMAYMLFLSAIMVAYFILSVWAVAFGSKVGANGRTKQASLLYQTVEELRERVEKQMAKYHPTVLEMQPQDASGHLLRKPPIKERHKESKRVTNQVTKHSTAPAKSGRDEKGEAQTQVPLKGDIGATVENDPRSQNHDKFWTRLWRKISVWKAPSSATSTAPAKIAETNGSKALLPDETVYKYSGDEDSDADQSGDNDDVISRVGKVFWDNFNKKQAEKKRGTRDRSRGGRDDSDSDDDDSDDSYDDTRSRRRQSRSFRETRYDDYDYSVRYRDDYYDRDVDRDADARRRRSYTRRERREDSPYGRVQDVESGDDEVKARNAIGNGQEVPYPLPVPENPDQPQLEGGNQIPDA